MDGVFRVNHDSDSSEEGIARDRRSHENINLSPELQQRIPNVYSENPARRMADERLAEIDGEIKRRLENNHANHLSSNSLIKLQAYAEIEKEIRKALDGGESALHECPKELEDVREAIRICENLINADLEYYKTGCSKELWTLLSGSVSYTLTFCTGTLLASGLNIPLLSPLIIGVCWTLCERFPPMIRATSWSNKHADKTYQEILRMTKRAMREWPRWLSKLEPKYFMHNGKKMTASQVRATYSLWEAWKGKVCSDDLVSHTFTLCYIVRNVLLATLTTEIFLKSQPGMVISLGTLALSGLVAGATAALGFQGIRGCRYRAENPDKPASGENLVKSMKIWDAESYLATAKIALIKKYELNHAQVEADKLADGVSLMEADRAKAIAKSSFFSSLRYEFFCLFQKMGHAGDYDHSEVSDNFHQTLAGLYAKMVCLLASAFFITLAVKVFAKPESDLALALGLMIIAPIILIVGFGFRKELEIVATGFIGLNKGCVDVMKYFVTHKDKYQDHKTDSPQPERSPLFSDRTEVSGRQTPESPTSQKLRGNNMPDETAKVGSSSSSSFEDRGDPGCSSRASKA